MKVARERERDEREGASESSSGRSAEERGGSAAVGEREQLRALGKRRGVGGWNTR